MSFSIWSALSPWPLIYVVNGGPSVPWYVNTGIWITAVFGLIIITLREKIFGIFLIIFFMLGITFIYIFPAPYTQYFLPLSVFASMLSAYLIYWIIKLFTNYSPYLHLMIMLLVLALLGSSFFIQYQIRTGNNAINQEQVEVLKKVARIVNKNETIYDMVGSYIYRHDGFEICCHPYGEFWLSLKVKRPTLSDSLIENQTKFIILDRTGQVLWKPFSQDLEFIRNNYLEAKK